MDHAQEVFGMARAANHDPAKVLQAANSPHMGVAVEPSTMCTGIRCRRPFDPGHTGSSSIGRIETGRLRSPLKRKARRGFRGYPVATVAFYGPDDTHATKVAVAIVATEGAEPDPLERWFAEDMDVRTDPAIGREILEFIQRHRVKSVVMTDGIIGCPHEEGVDYPDGQACPRCPFWAHRDRWSGEVIQ